MAAVPPRQNTSPIEPALEHLYVQLVWEIIALKACLPALALKGGAGLLERQGQRILEKYGRYITLIQDQCIDPPPSRLEIQHRQKQWSYLLHKWQRICGE